MGKTKYSRKTLVGKKKNNTMKKKYPKKQKGKKLKNKKKIKMKKKANKIKRKYSLKVKKQRGGGGSDDNNVPTTCSLCLNDIDSNAIIVSKPNKDGNCPKGFKKEGDFCVSTNIKDETTVNIKTSPTTVVTPSAPPLRPNVDEMIKIMDNLADILELEGIPEDKRTKKIEELIVEYPDYKTNYVYHALLDYRPDVIPRHERLEKLYQYIPPVAKAVSSSSSKITI